ncbi:MAG: class F sortase [Sporichthyaceae bacterium]
MGRQGNSRRRKWAAGGTLAAVAFGGGMFALLHDDGRAAAEAVPVAAPIPLPDPIPEVVEILPKPEPKKPVRCTTAKGPLIPTSASIKGVDSDIEVVALRRLPLSPGTSSTPPVSGGGKVQMAFDLGGMRLGGAAGNALLNAHTWPDGSALGNKLLGKLQEGDRIVLAGPGGKLCYKVAERVEVPASSQAAVKKYYARTGRPQIAIAVCSGKRLGPGDWSHRTLWFASPVE